jgi:UPF0755 protein
VRAQFASAPDYPGPGSGEVVVQVEPGQTAADVATTLRDEDVVASRTAFLEVANPDPALGQHPARLLPAAGR